MRFTKMHGIGNDYVYIDGSIDPSLDLARAARLVSDRHLAIGSDGLIAVCPPTTRTADVRMRMFNADGSEGEMCGNGIRCVAKFAVDRGIATVNPLRVETMRGILEVEWTRDVEGKVVQASVRMGAPILEHARIPARLERVAPDARVVGHTIDLSRFGDDWWREARVEPHVTLACGTGASAVCVAGVLLGKSARTLDAMLPGGPLLLEWPQEDADVRMTGGATEVFEGEVDLEQLADSLALSKRATGAAHVG